MTGHLKRAGGGAEQGESAHGSGRGGVGGLWGGLNLYIIDATVRDCQRHV